MMSQHKAGSLFWILLIAAVSLLIHLLTYNTLGFHRDELLYLALGEHPAAGYWSNPPVIGMISYLSQLLPWDPLFNTRLLPAIAGAFLIILTGLITRELGGAAYASILSCLILSFSLLILRGFSMLQPVPFDILIWTTILYFLLRYLNTLKPVWLIWTGVATGFGMLNKYIVVFLIFGILVGLLFTKHRKLLISRYLWISVAIAIIIFLPNLIWQYLHGFPVFIHMQELKETQLVNVDRTNILTDQLLMFTFGSVVWIAGLMWLITNRDSKKYRFFAFVYIAVLSVFLLLRGKSYYMAGLYPFMFAAGGVAWEKILNKLTPRIILVALLLLLSMPLVPAGVPVMKAPGLASYFEKMPKRGAEALLRWEDGQMHSLPQDFADMLGWDELAEIVINASDTVSDKGRIMIYGENYGQAGALDHFGKPFNLPPAASFSDSYLLWIPDSLPRDKVLLFYINDERGDDIFPMFERVDSLGSITNPYAREFGTSVYLCISPKPEFFDFFNAKSHEIKEYRFQR